MVRWARSGQLGGQGTAAAGEGWTLKESGPALVLQVGVSQAAPRQGCTVETHCQTHLDLGSIGRPVSDDQGIGSLPNSGSETKARHKEKRREGADRVTKGSTS